MQTAAYPTIDDLPFVLRINLPKDALEVYRDAFNRALRNGENTRRAAETQAWAEVRKRFARDKVTGRWTAAEPRTALASS
jgi:cation transport regulator ChaB